MNFALQSPYFLQASPQECLVPFANCLPNSFGPLVWHLSPVVNPEVNFSYSLYPNYQMVLQPLGRQSALEAQGAANLKCKQLPIQNRQKIPDYQDQQETGRGGPRRRSKLLTRPKVEIGAHKKVIGKSKLACRQNPRRNIVTNIGNQLLTFTTNKSKCVKALEILPSSLDQQELAGFFSYARRLRSRIGYYLNYAKMRNIWYPRQPSPSCENHQKMLRTVSYFYLCHVLRLVVLNSAKMQKKSKNYHIKAIRKLIRDLRNPPRPY